MRTPRVSALSAFLSYLPVLFVLLNHFTRADAQEGTSAEGGLYFNVEPVNTTDSLNLLRVLPLRTFEFRHDTVRGRRQLGVIGQELMQIVPESVSLVDKQAFPSPIKGAPPVHVENFLSVDKNVVFMHGLASAQELVLLYDTLEEIVNELSSVVAEHDALIGKLSEHLERDAVVDLIEKRRVAEANSEKLRLEIEEVRVKEEQARITLERQTELEEKRDEHRNDLEVERIKTQDRIQRERDLALVELQEKSARRLEEQRRETEQILHEQTLKAEAEKAREDREAELERLKQEIEGRIRQERINEDIHMRQLQAKAAEDRRKLLEAVQTTLAGLGDGVKSLLGDKKKLYSAVGSIVSMAAGIYVVREISRIVGAQVEKRLGKPSLVRETSRSSGVLPLLLSCLDLFSFLLFWRKRKDITSAFSDVVLKKTLEERVRGLALSTKNARMNKAPFRHLLLYGPPGTGKTMVAKRLARWSGLDYAIMSGGDVGPLGSEAVTELHKLFGWANSSKKGLLLFIDEAEAFLGCRSRNNMSEEMRNALNAMLFQTGEQSNNFMMVLATNRPSDLDAAVVDRMDETLEFGVPEEHERNNMLNLYYDKCVLRSDIHIKGDQKGIFARCAYWGRRAVRRVIHGPCPPMIQCEEISNQMLKDAAKKTKGFSGREISKLVLSLQGAAYGRDDCVLSKAMFADVLTWKVKEHTQKARMAKEVEPNSACPIASNTVPATPTPASEPQVKSEREPKTPATPQLPM